MPRGKIVVVFTIVSAAPVALAQNPQRQSSHAVPQGAPQQPVSTQMLMQSSGGSLLQASMPQSAGNDNGRSPAYSLYAVAEPEPKVIKKHALINIVVREESQSNSQGTTDLKRQADLDAKVEQWIHLNMATLSVHPTSGTPNEIKMSGQRDFKGDATASRTDSVILRIEAEVIDVKPNGTLVVQARKHIKSEEEEQTFILTGVCRVEDVDASNSVLSTDLHDLDLQKITKGAVRDTTKRGLLGRLLDFINPF